MNSIELSLFSSRMEAICNEMGAVLRNAAFSPNIRDRLDFSCAVFDVQGELCAQAAHIPVHLGSMAFAMRDIVSKITWQDGDMVILNDPFMGGTHLPDVTLIAPLFKQKSVIAFLVNRAHHADIGASTPGSMPISSSLKEEGIIIEPSLLIRQGKRQSLTMKKITHATRNPTESEGDLSAQISANQTGLTRLAELVDFHGFSDFSHGLDALNHYANQLAHNSLSSIPDGTYQFVDVMDDDGQGAFNIPIHCSIKVQNGLVAVDFSGTSKQVKGNINCPLSVTAAAVYYVFRCLMPTQTPACSGTFRPISLFAPAGCFLNASFPAAVAAGNVETSTRIVDVVMGALAQALPEIIPAASQGSMNNLALGSDKKGNQWDYYETIGGGMGGGRKYCGLSGIQTHMTNTLNTPIEVLESRYPVRILQYKIRNNSGGSGKNKGGDGLIREFQFLADTQVSLLTERRTNAPWGIGSGSGDGKTGNNFLNNQRLPGKISLHVDEGDILRIETPGGGGYSHTFHNTIEN